jgi:transcriptional repressor NrdR
VSCDKCGAETEVVDSRGNEKGRYIIRRRRCTGCGERFSTYEVSAQTYLRFAAVDDALDYLERAGDNVLSALNAIRDAKEAAA